MDKHLVLGIDIGSVSIKTAFVDLRGSLIADSYTRIKGDPVRILENELRSIFSGQPEELVFAAGITGSGGKAVAEALGAYFVNEVTAQAAFAAKFHPQTKTIIEMGGEDSKLIILSSEGGKSRIEDFSMNAACAAGTGSFLDQQASRLHLTIEEFSSLALKSKKPPAVAGRCSVFAKSDMIHLQQIATPDFDIVAGLCYAMARNFKATVGKGKKFEPPILFVGGVAANLGMQRAFNDILGLDGVLDVPDHFNTSGAIGAALTVLEQKVKPVSYRGLSGLKTFKKSALRKSEAALAAPASIMPNVNRDAFVGEGKIGAYLGVDVGSVSTNVVVIDEGMRVLSKRYLPTAGRPIEAVKQGLAEVGAEIGGFVVIKGAAATGSGRYLTGDMIGADVVINEITAQATAAAAIDPSVDTIFEIGGQDSKFISLEQGAVVDFEMNKACAAGTGSFLEEQAERLGIRIKDEFADRALCAASPCGMGERCTVFIESDLVHYRNSGAGIEDLTAGLAYSIARNYLNKVAAGKRIGKRIFFQGGVAANKAVVAAFEQITGRPVTVPPHHEVTGAIGAAIIALRSKTWEESRFKGFDLSKRSYTVSTFTCAECANRCDIRKVSFDGEAPFFYGSRCEKYDVKRTTSESDRPKDLFSEREALLAAAAPAKCDGSGPVIGIPRVLYLNDFLPYFQTFFSELGFKVVLSDRTTRSLIQRGLEASTAETCFPAKTALGHILDLLDQSVDFIFLPSLVRLPSLAAEGRSSQACPYGQAIPYLTKAALRIDDQKLLIPDLNMQNEQLLMAGLLKIGRFLNKNSARVRQAHKAAAQMQKQFEQSLKQRGKEILSSLKPDDRVLVLIGRTYNTCDSGMNLNLASKIRDLGIQVMPLDFLPLQDVDLCGMEQMYWRSGRKILAAARFIKSRDGLFPVYITNFGCGPDSFITHFFKQEMNDKPFLQLEIDEHSADAGAITRIEAFLDSLKNKKPDSRDAVFAVHTQISAHKRTVFIPHMADHARAVAAAFRACGVNAEALPESDEESAKIGKEHSSGRECYPLALTTGDMIKTVQRPDFDPEKSAFFMPGGKGPCRFGQYNRYHRLVLDRLGFGNVPILSPMQDESMYRQVGMVGKDLIRLIWNGALAVDILQKMLHEHRPYEKEIGAADRLYEKSLRNIEASIERRGDVAAVLADAYRMFSSVAKAGRNRPVIGIVGEIYIRGNRFANENIIRQIEQLGGEAWVAPLSEWLLYLNETAKVSARMNRRWGDLVKAHIAHRIQIKDEHRMIRSLNSALRSLHEPSIDETLRRALPYVHYSFEGEAVLSVGKAVDYIVRGASGIVNVMPFTCMPGTITAALLKRLREDFGNIPFLSIAYDGQKDTQTMTRLEAFMHQAQEHVVFRRRAQL